MIDSSLLFQRAAAAQEAGDFARARRLFRELGPIDPETGWLCLGYLLDTGKGGAEDKAEAMRCYRLAWKAGSPSAANNIAILYRERGSSRLMFEWFRRAAEAGDAGCYLDMAKCYRDGIGVRASLVDAVRCLRLMVDSEFACEAEREEAAKMLGGHRLREVLADGA